MVSVVECTAGLNLSQGDESRAVTKATPNLASDPGSQSGQD
jgi:hypothetical protein